MESATSRLFRLLHGRGIIYSIAIFKLFKGSLMILTALAAVALTRDDVFERLRQWSNDLDVGPFRLLVGQWVGRHVLGMTDKTLFSIAVGALLYSGLFFTEGIGLLFDRPWAEWVVVFTTGGLIPFEVAEFARHRHPLMVLMFFGNVAIVIYLVHRVRERMKEHAVLAAVAKASETPPAPARQDAGSCAPGK